jgi:hypothetical protein
MTGIFQLSELLRRARFELRFGEWSRRSLELLRIEVSNKEACCDWLARPADEWDAYIPMHAAAKNFTAQTLDDAIKIRAMLFSVLDEVQTAELQAFRTLPDHRRELILTGTVFRHDTLPARSVSLAMQAKLLGFHFTLADGSLIRLGEHTDSSPDARFGSSYPTHLKEVS